MKAAPSSEAQRQAGRGAVRAFYAVDADEAIRVLRIGAGVGLVFLLAYLIVDLRERAAAGAALTVYHAAALGVLCLFFAATWLPAMRRRWRAPTFAMCVALIALFVAISTVSREPESRFAAIVLTLLTTAAFVRWGPRWQAVMNAAGIAAFAAAQALAPVGAHFLIYRWLGLVAAAVLAQCIAIFMSRFRRELFGRLEQLEEAARFRERQIAIMAHDIRNPVSALHGFVNLIEDGGLSESERAALLARVGAAAAAAETVVGNVLDLYMLDEGRLERSAREVDPAVIVANAAEDCAREARRRGVKLSTELARLPCASLDPRHLERIVANLLRLAIGRAAGGEVRLSTALSDGQMRVQVDDNGPALDSRAIEALLHRPAAEAGSAEIGPYIAAALAHKSGGTIEAMSQNGRGLSVVVRLPLKAPAQS